MQRGRGDNRPPTHLEVVHASVVGHALVQDVFYVVGKHLDGDRPWGHEDLVHETRAVYCDEDTGRGEQLHLLLKLCLVLHNDVLVRHVVLLDHSLCVIYVWPATLFQD